MNVVLRHPEFKLSCWTGLCFSQQIDEWVHYEDPEHAWQANNIGVPCKFESKVVRYDDVCQGEIDPEKSGKYLVQINLQEFRQK